MGVKTFWKKISSEAYWKKLPLLLKLVNWAKNTSAPGFKKVPLYDVVVFIYREAMRDDIVTRANSMAYSFFLALFPTIIFLFTLMPLIPTVADYALDIRESVNGLLPAASEEYLFSAVDDIVSRQRNGLLSFGLILAIIFASNGMMSLLKGFEKVNRSTFKSRHWFKKRLVAIALTVVIVFIFIISSGLVVLGHLFINLLDNWLDLNFISELGFSVVRWVIVIGLIYASISVLYRYGPAVNKRFNFFSTGATVATLLIIISSIGFSYFVANFGKYNQLYGSIGALIVTLIWFNIICFLILVGFELNASIAVNRDLKKKIEV